MSRALWIVALVVAAASPHAAGADERADPFHAGRHAIRVFTDRDGLPQNAVSAMAFDAEGRLWAGTKDGVTVYNGRSWQTVELPARLRSRWTQAILVDSDGFVWLGTRGGGVARLAGGEWEVYDAALGLPGDEVYCLVEATDPRGRRAVHAGTDGGVCRFVDGRWEALPPLGGPARFAVKCLAERVAGDGARELWAGTEGGGLGRFRDGRWTLFTAANSGLPEDRVWALLETAALDGSRSLVVGTHGGGLARVDGGEVVPYDGARQLPREFVTCLRETRGADGALELWAGTLGGVARYEGGRWLHYGAEAGLPGVGVWSLLDSPSPNGTRALWIGTAGGGIARWEMGKWSSFDASSGLPNSSVYAVLVTGGEGSADEVWAGTVSGGLARFAGGRWTAVEAGPAGGAEDGDSGPFGEGVRCLLGDGARELWVGTSGKGLLVRRGASWRRYGMADGLPSPIVTSLASAGSDDRPALWVGTAGGLARIEGGRIVPPDPALELPDPRVNCVLEAGGGATLWVGTERGLARFENGATARYDRSNGLPSDAVLCAVEVSLPGGPELWVGTRGGVGRLPLGRADAAWGAPLSTASAPALPNDTVYQVRQDARGRVYLFTNKGVARLTPDPRAEGGFATYTYTVEDGLPSNECNTGASFVDARGRVWAGTVAGLAVLDPAREVEDPAPKPLRVDRAALLDGRRRFGSGAKLAYDENSVVFEYALASYFREADTRYRTQLLGLDPAPSPWTADPKKEYTSLPAGGYVFRVWGMDAYGNVTGPVELPFRVTPAPWATWWAFAAYAVGLVGLVYFSVRVRVRTLRRRTLQLEAGIAERTAELGSKVAALGESERRAQQARDDAVESERRARESERRAHEASRAKSVFLANMSHELRTPLNAILGFVQLMRRDASLSDEQREHLRVIMRSGEHLLALINDVLSLSKIEAGRETLEPAPFDLHRLLDGLVEMFRLRAESKGLALEADVASSVPRFVEGDEGKLRQVLINLLGNAVKFTDEGHVTLRARWRGGRATFEVADTGPGLTPEEVESIFKAFVQTKRGLFAQEGTGLGLAISRDYAKMMGGDVTVESEPGRGATFRLELELPECEAAEAAPEPRRVIALEPGQPAWRALVADDMPENRHFLAKLLEAVGFRVWEASDGREALEVWRREAPHLVLMDVRMPGMDGISATRAIRDMEREQGPGSSGQWSVVSGQGAGRGGQAPEESIDGRDRSLTPAPCSPTPTTVIALTASAFEHDRLAILEAGCDDFVPKPFREEVIFDRIAERLGARFVYQEEEPPEEAMAAAAGAGPVLTMERFERVPAELLTDLAHAATIGDAAAALEVVERIGERDEPLGGDLKKLVRNYQFDEILDLLTPR